MATLLHGFQSLKDLVNERITDNNVAVVNTAYTATIASHNLVTQQMLGLFCTPTTIFKARYKSPVAARLQGLDEHGRARKIKMAGHYDIALPLRQAGTAFGGTRLSRAKMTIQEANDQLSLALDADLRWQRDQILAALFTNANYTFRDEENGDLTILPLANGDSQEYLVRAGAEAGESSVQHFRTFSAMDNTNQPFTTLYRDLTKRPENGGAGAGKVIAFIPSNLRTNVEALSAFIQYSDADIRIGADNDELVGTLGVSVPGEIVGKVGKCWIVEWAALPDNYIIGVCTAGDRPLAVRVPTVPEFQGFHAVADRNDQPYWEREFHRYAGFGAWNRVNAMVYQLTGGAYAIPTGLSQPMA